MKYLWLPFSGYALLCWSCCLIAIPCFVATPVLMESWEYSELDKPLQAIYLIEKLLRLECRSHTYSFHCMLLGLFCSELRPLSTTAMSILILMRSPFKEVKFWYIVSQFTSLPWAHVLVIVGFWQAFSLTTEISWEYSEFNKPLQAISVTWTLLLKFNILKFNILLLKWSII